MLNGINLHYLPAANRACKAAQPFDRPTAVKSCRHHDIIGTVKNLGLGHTKTAALTAGHRMPRNKFHPSGKQSLHVLRQAAFNACSIGYQNITLQKRHRTFYKIQRSCRINRTDHYICRLQSWTCPAKSFVDNSLFLSLPQHLAVSIDTDDLLYAQAPQRFGIRTADKSHTYHSKSKLLPIRASKTTFHYVHLVKLSPFYNPTII